MKFGPAELRIRPLVARRRVGVPPALIRAPEGILALFQLPLPLLQTLLMGDQRVLLRADQLLAPGDVGGGKDSVVLGFLERLDALASSRALSSVACTLPSAFTARACVCLTPVRGWGRRAYRGQAPARRLRVSVRCSGITFTSARTGMKFVSPAQRGTTCRWTWSTTPAPAIRPRFQPRLYPCGP